MRNAPHRTENPGYAYGNITFNLAADTCANLPFEVTSSCQIQLTLSDGVIWQEIHLNMNEHTTLGTNRNIL